MPLPLHLAATTLPPLDPDKLTHLLEQYGPPLIQAVVLLVVGLSAAGYLSRFVHNACTRAKFDLTLTRFLSNLVRWAILAAVVIMCLGAFGVQVTSLVAILGTVGVAIGLAMQGSLSHIACGVMLLIFRPFKVGDLVQAGGQTGIVDEIDLFSTLLRTPDNRRIIVPNGSIVGAVIINNTHFPERVVEVSLTSDGGPNLETARHALTAAATNLPARLPDKPPVVTLTALAPAPTWTVALWTHTATLEPTREQLLLACHHALAEANALPKPAVSLVRSVQ